MRPRYDLASRAMVLSTPQPAPTIYLRAQHDEWNLIPAYGDLIDHVLLCERYLVPGKGSRGSRLLEAAETAGKPVSRDPSTAALVSRSTQRLPASSPYRELPGAKVFGLPLRPDTLSDPDARAEFVAACLEPQSSAADLVSPYLDVPRLTSIAFDINLQMFRATASSAMDQTPTGVLQTTRHGLLNGLLSEAAPAIAGSGVSRLLIRVRGLKPGQASSDDLNAYLDAVGALKRVGVEPVPDCVGLLGPLLVWGGAPAFSVGTGFFQSVPQALFSLPTDDGGGGVAIPLMTSTSWTSAPRTQSVSAKDARIANLRAIRQQADLAAQDPDAFLALMAQDDSVSGQRWSAALLARKAA